MTLFDSVNDTETYWVISDRNGKFWSTRDQNWMGFTRATLYDNREKAEKNLYSVSFLFKNDVELHDPCIRKVSVEVE